MATSNWTWEEDGRLASFEDDNGHRTDALYDSARRLSLITDAKGPAGDLVSAAAETFQAFAAQDWPQVIASLQPAMVTHERIGGSRAQRDLLEFTMLAALLRNGQSDAARLMLATRRPAQMPAQPVAGL